MLRFIGEGFQEADSVKTELELHSSGDGPQFLVRVPCDVINTYTIDCSLPNVTASPSALEWKLRVSAQVSLPPLPLNAFGPSL